MADDGRNVAALNGDETATVEDPATPTTPEQSSKPGTVTPERPSVPVVAFPGGETVVVEPNPVVSVTDPPDVVESAVTYQWLRQISWADADTHFAALGVNAAGDVVVAGGAQVESVYAAVVMKLSGLDGSDVWRVELDPEREGSAEGVAVDANGDVLVSGALNDDAFVAKLSGMDGTELWRAELGVDGRDDAAAVAVDGDGNVFIGGSTEQGDLDGEGNQGDADAYVAKLSGADGAVLWVQQFGSDLPDGANALAVDGSGDVLVTGFTEGIVEEFNHGDNDGFVGKFSGADGSLAWLRQIGTQDADYPAALAVTPDGNAYVAGRTVAAEISEATLALYAGTDGSTVWSTASDVGGDTRADALSLDAAGRVLIAGETGTSGGSLFDGFLQVYGADGDAAALQRFGTPELDAAHAAVFGSDGSVFVTGLTAGNLTGTEERRDGALPYPPAFVGRALLQ